MRHTRAAAANGADFTKLNNRKLNLPAICLTEAEFLVPKFAVRSKFGSRLTAKLLEPYSQSSLTYLT